MSQQKTCILYFTTGKTSRKAFSAKKQQKNAIQKVLFEHTLSEIKKSKLPFLINDGAAHGSDFYARIKGSIQQVFNNGFEHIIIIGDDAPMLKAEFILKAQEGFSKNKLSIGPCRDGGTYLIAFNKNQFEANFLDNLPWQQTNFYQQLSLNITKLGLANQTFEVLSDIDFQKDVERFYLQFHAYPLAQLLKDILEKSAQIKEIQILLTSIFLDFAEDRGPPLNLA